jgi:hypothetical protein
MLNIVLLLCYIAYIALVILFVAVVIRRKRRRTKRPLCFKYHFVRKEKRDTYMSLVYELTCAPTTEVDVVERKLVVTVNGEVVSTDSYSRDTTSLGERTFAQGDNVVLSLVDIDDAGNVSEPAMVEFTALDTIAPSTPGLTVTLVREE